MHVIAVVNQKGGVGKTTTAVNLAAGLSMLSKKKAMLIDIDPQGNASSGLGVGQNSSEQPGVGSVLLGTTTWQDNLSSISDLNLDVLPAGHDLVHAELQLLKNPKGPWQLAEKRDEWQSSYQWIVIDCPPALNILTINALMAADSVLIPLVCDYFSLEGLSGIMATLSDLRHNRHPKLKILGLLRTMYDSRARLTQDVSQEIEKYFGEFLLKTVIPKNIRLAEAPSHGQSIVQYDNRSKGAQAYRQLATEVTTVVQQLVEVEQEQEVAHG